MSKTRIQFYVCLYATFQRSQRAKVNNAKSDMQFTFALIKCISYQPYTTYCHVECVVVKEDLDADISKVKLDLFKQSKQKRC